MLQWQPATFYRTTTLEGGMVGTLTARSLPVQEMNRSPDHDRALPDGLFTGNTISGTPTMAGNFSFTVKAQMRQAALPRIKHRY